MIPNGRWREQLLEIKLYYETRTVNIYWSPEGSSLRKLWNPISYKIIIKADRHGATVH